MPIIIEKITPSDASEIIPLRAAAFTNDKLINSALPQPMTSSQEKQLLAYRFRKMDQRLKAPDRHYFKAIDTETGKMVAFSGWQEPARKDKEVIKEERIEVEDEKKVQRDGDVDALPGFMKKEVFEGVNGEFAKAKREALGGRGDFWFLQAMAVLPEYQGRGIASSLLKQGFEDLVDKDGLVCYLEASPGSDKLYAKHNFETVRPISFLDGEYVVTAMLRKERPSGP